MITYLAYIFTIVFLVGLDQYTKQLIVTYIPLNERLEIIPNFFNITHVRNTGAAWSMLEGQKLIFIVITIVAIIYFSYLLIKDKDKPFINKLCYLLIVSGAIGNFIDRLINSYVVDFLSFKLFGFYDFPVFNVADCFLTVGVSIYIIISIVEMSREKN